MLIPFSRWASSAPDVDAGARSPAVPWLSGAPFAAPAALRPALPSSLFPLDRWLAGAPLINPANSSAFARWVSGAPFLCPAGSAPPPPIASGSLTITCIDGVSTTADVRPGVNGRWCPACRRLWVAAVDSNLSHVRVFEGTSNDAIGALAVATPTTVSAASADPSWTPAIAASSDRYVAGYPVLKIL